jgi:endonuclease YncB( thermonuclease family)
MSAPEPIEVKAVSLNHRRRIFRSSMAPVPRRRGALPSAGMLLAAAVGAAAVLAALWLFVRSSDAPARAPVSGHIVAGAGDFAVLDGNTLRLGDAIVQLAGIVAPQRGSVCHGDRQAELDCGSAAANALSALLRGRTVDCAIVGHDKQGRPVGNCLAGGRQLSEALVLEGWARAEAADLAEPETAARTAGRGIWRSGS